MRGFGTGVGTRISVIGDKAAFSAIGKRGRFRGAWFCSGAESVRVAVGYVNGLEPFLDGRPMSGKDAKGIADPRGVPVLKIKADGFDKDGRSWIGVLARVGADLKLPSAKDLKAEDLRVIQSAGRFSENESEGFFPIAALKLRVDGTWTLRQIAYFDLQHGTRKPEKGRVQHFFWPT